MPGRLVSLSLNKRNEHRKCTPSGTQSNGNYSIKLSLFCFTSAKGELNDEIVFVGGWQKSPKSIRFDARSALSWQTFPKYPNRDSKKPSVSVTDQRTSFLSLSHFHSGVWPTQDDILKSKRMQTFGLIEQRRFGVVSGIGAPLLGVCASRRRINCSKASRWAAQVGEDLEGWPEGRRFLRQIALLLNDFESQTSRGRFRLPLVDH